MAEMKKKIGRYSAFEKKKFLFVYLFVAFPVLQFLIFWVATNFSSIVYAFQDEKGTFTFENIQLVFDSMFTRQPNANLGLKLFPILRRSMFLWGLDFFILFPIGVTTTYILFRRLPGHYVFRLCYIIPSLMGAVIWTKLVRYMVFADGPVIQLLESMNVPMSFWARHDGLFAAQDTAFPTIVTIKVIMGLVGNNAVLTGAFTRVPEELYESAELDGAGFWRTYISVAVPCVWSTIATLLTFSLCSFVTADYNVYLYTNGFGGNGTETIGYLLFRMTQEISDAAAGTEPYYGYPAALGLVLTCITLPVVLIGRRLIDRIYADVEV